MIKPRILAIADVPGWVFDQHARTLSKMLGDTFRISVDYAGVSYNEADYDLIYPLEWNLVNYQCYRHSHKYVTGIRSHLFWPDVNFIKFTEMLRNNFAIVHVVSRRLYETFEHFVPSLKYVTHGVDTRFFCPWKKAGNNPSLRVGWAGNRKSPAKGFETYIKPLESIPNVELVYVGYSDKKLDRQNMKKWYNEIDVYVCSSASEGNNNPLMEAAAMERGIITTDNGTVPEYLTHGKSAIIVERTQWAFRDAVIAFRENRSLCRALGTEARKSVISLGFDWTDTVQGYKMMFEEALQCNQ